MWPLAWRGLGYHKEQLRQVLQICRERKSERERERKREREREREKESGEYFLRD